MIDFGYAAGIQIAAAGAIPAPIPFDLLPPQSAWLIVVGLLLAVCATLAVFHGLRSVTPQAQRDTARGTRPSRRSRPEFPRSTTIRPKIA